MHDVRKQRRLAAPHDKRRLMPGRASSSNLTGSGPVRVAERAHDDRLMQV